VRNVEASAEIHAAAGELFAFLADPANLPAWQTGIVAAEQTSPGVASVGGTARVVRELMGQRITADLEVTAYEPGSRLALSSTVSGIHVDATLELEPRGETTWLRFGMAIKAESMFMAPIEGVVADAAHRDIADSLARLKELFAGR
jgi:hypothetical protein